MARRWALQTGLHTLAKYSEYKKNLIFRITKPPSHGNLRVGNVSDVIEFSQADVDNGLLTYQHNGFPDVTDSVDYIVTANDQSTNGSVSILGRTVKLMQIVINYHLYLPSSSARRQRRDLFGL